MFKNMIKNLVLKAFLSPEKKNQGVTIDSNDLTSMNGTYHLGLRKENGKIKYYLDITGDLDSLPRSNRFAIGKLRDELNGLLEKKDDNDKTMGGLIC